MKNAKLFVIRKYVWAQSASEALRKERRIEPDDIWLDDDWKKQQDYKSGEIGFVARGKAKKKVIPLKSVE